MSVGGASAPVGCARGARTHGAAGFRKACLIVFCAAQAVLLGSSQAAGLPSGQILLFGECSPAINHLVLDNDLLARDSSGRQRVIDVAALTALLHDLSTGTRGFSQAWIARTADAEGDGFGVTDAPCLRLSLQLNGVAQELRWPMVLEPWDEDSRVLHELQVRLGSLAAP